MATIWCPEVTPHWMQHWSIWKCHKFLKHCLCYQWMLNRAETQRVFPEGASGNTSDPCIWNAWGWFWEQKKKRRGNQWKPLHKLWLTATTLCSLYHELSKADLFLKLVHWVFLFAWFLRFFLKVDLRNPRRSTHLIMDPYRESMTWKVWEQVKHGIRTARNPQESHNKISHGISLSAPALDVPPWEQLYHFEFSNNHLSWSEIVPVLPILTLMLASTH